jgi:hypothetical protein
VSSRTLILQGTYPNSNGPSASSGSTAPSVSSQSQAPAASPARSAASLPQPPSVTEAEQRAPSPLPTKAAPPTQEQPRAANEPRLPSSLADLVTSFESAKQKCEFWDVGGLGHSRETDGLVCKQRCEGTTTLGRFIRSSTPVFPTCRNRLTLRSGFFSAIPVSLFRGLPVVIVIAGRNITSPVNLLPHPTTTRKSPLVNSPTRLCLPSLMSIRYSTFSTTVKGLSFSEFNHRRPSLSRGR